MRKLVSLLLCALIIVLLTGCSAPSPAAEQQSMSSTSAENSVTEPSSRRDDIIIIFTNDVHCAVDENIGYAGLAAYKKQAEGESPYVTLVDAGDAVQGSALGFVSKGALITDIMNYVGYDYAAIGNHEFDYGIQRLSEIIDAADFQYLCCNISYTGSGESALSGVKPYALEEYGDTCVAFIGVSTPHSISDSVPQTFKENGEYVYDFAADESGERLAQTVQASVDECREAGADYVVLLSHLGGGRQQGVYDSEALIAKTRGIDAVIDGHSHEYITGSILNNADGEEVLLAQTGTGLTAVGRLSISPDGTLTMGCKNDLTLKDADTEAELARLTGQYSAELEKTVGHTDVALSTDDADGIRLVRSRETGIGNFTADAYRLITGADIGLVNGGGVRSGLEAGNITYGDLININPFGNMLCTVELTGSEILDMMEYFVCAVEKDYAVNGEAVGESGSFPCVSGLKFTVRTDIDSPVLYDENFMLTGIEGERRVCDACVLENGEYVPLDPEKTYVLASNEYILKNGGCGMELFLKDHPMLRDSVISDYQALAEYLGTDPDMTRYIQPEGRIIISG